LRNEKFPHAARVSIGIYASQSALIYGATLCQFAGKYFDCQETRARAHDCASLCVTDEIYSPSILSRLIPSRSIEISLRTKATSLKYFGCLSSRPINLGFVDFYETSKNNVWRYRAKETFHYVCTTILYT